MFAQQGQDQSQTFTQAHVAAHAHTVYTGTHTHTQILCEITAYKDLDFSLHQVFHHIWPQ